MIARRKIFTEGIHRHNTGAGVGAVADIVRYATLFETPTATHSKLTTTHAKSDYSHSKRTAIRYNSVRRTISAVVSRTSSERGDNTMRPVAAPISFKATTTDISFLASLCEALKNFVGSVNFLCDEEGISVTTMDTAQVSLVSVKMKAEAFDVHYYCPRYLVIGVSVSPLSTILKCLTNEKGGILTLLKRDNVDLLEIECHDEEGTESTYKMKLLSVNEETLSTQNIDYELRISLPQRLFSKLIKDLEKFGQSISIKFHPIESRFILSSSGGTSEVDTQFSFDTQISNDVKIDYNGDLNASSVGASFSIQHLTHYAKVSSFVKNVSLCLHSQFPLRVELENEKFSEFHFYLASKIDEEAQST